MAKNTAGIKPLHDYLLITPLDEEKKTDSGIILPKSDKEKPQMGEVLAVGPGVYDEDGEKRVPMDVKVGDKVLYKKGWNDEEIKLGDDIFLLVKQTDIKAIIV